MRVLRISMYSPDVLNGPETPTTMVIREDSLKVSIEEAIAEQRAIPGMWISFDIFEDDEDLDQMALTMKAMELLEPRLREEMDQAVLYYYDAMLLRQAKVIGSKSVAPLTAKQVEEVFEQLALHPDYDNQAVITLTKDDFMVSLAGGKVKINHLEAR